MTVEELREKLLRVDKAPLYCAGGQCGFTEGKHIPTAEEIDSLISAARAEGAEQERERIRKGSEKVETLNEAYHAVECHFPPMTPLYVVPELMLILSKEEYPTIDEYLGETSALSPAPKEPTDDQKIARLAEIIQPVEEPEVTIITGAGSATKEEK